MANFPAELNVCG